MILQLKPTLAFSFVNYDAKLTLSSFRMIESITSQEEAVYLRDFATTRVDEFQQTVNVPVDVLALEFDPETGEALGWGRRSGEVLQSKRNANWYNENGGTLLFYYTMAGIAYLSAYEVLLAPDELMQWQHFVAPVANVQYCAYIPKVLTQSQIDVLAGSARTYQQFPEITWDQTAASPVLARSASPNAPSITWNQLQSSPTLTRN